MADANPSNGSVNSNSRPSIEFQLTNHELELHEFAHLCGITIDPQIFRVILELLKLDVSPAAIFAVLKEMADQRYGASPTKRSSRNKSELAEATHRKKPPVAAKPKKIKSNCNQRNLSAS